MPWRWGHISADHEFIAVQQILRRKFHKRNIHEKPARRVSHRRLCLPTAASSATASGADAGRHRRGLRRHRHQPALRAPRSGGRRGGAKEAMQPRKGARRPVADPVGADLHRHAQIRAVPAARRQQRRGRHPGADGAGAAALGRQRRAHHPARHVGGALFYGDAIITPALRCCRPSRG